MGGPIAWESRCLSSDSRVGRTVLECGVEKSVCAGAMRIGSKLRRLPGLNRCGCRWQDSINNIYINNALVPLVLAVTVILFSSEVSLGSRFA